MPIPSLQLQKKDSSSREAEGLVGQLWSPRFVTMQCLCSQLWYETAANQRTLVEIELLATVGWKRGLPAFQLPMFAKCEALPKGDLLDMLVKGNPCLLKSKHLVPTRSRFLRATVRSTSSAIMVASCPSLPCSYRKKPVSCREGEGLHAVVVSKICDVQYSDCVQDLDCRMLIDCALSCDM